jgi:hypothetical protein
MALLSSDPKITIKTTRRNWTSFSGTAHYQDTHVKTVTWPCDDTGGEPTHEATYGTNGYQLVAYGPQVGYAQPSGLYVEEYHKLGSIN